MVADFKKIIQSLEKREYAPVYLVDGEEPFYIDMLTEYF
ncbi:MAG: DNA polymerase III subunit delta, partial [Taibaiella sp.]|nr:DNA polymerase III subunit delta [Taibaiella sp.]